MQVEVNSLTEMQQFAAKLAQSTVRGDVIALKGNLGAGKTTFSQFFINALCGSDQGVTSPTFNLVQIYNAPEYEVWHCDLYRLKNAEEFADLGVEDAFSRAVTIIEWPDIAAQFLPKNTKWVEIEAVEDKRIISVR